MGQANHRGTYEERRNAAIAGVSVAQYRQQSIDRFGHFGTENLTGIFSTGEDSTEENALKGKRSAAAKKAAATRKANQLARMSAATLENA